MEFLTDDEVKQIMDNHKMHRRSPFAMYGISNGQLSIARHYGGCKYQNEDYVYDAATDSLIRGDVMKWVREKRRKQYGESKPAKERPAKQGKLL